MHPLDMPEAYDDLSSLEREALAAWIELAVCPATKYTTRTSYGIKHDFEREGFYLTNGQFKGAMLAAGYRPEQADALNWVFKIKPVVSPGMRRTSDTFTIGLGNDSYKELLARVKEAYRVKAEEKEKANQSVREPSS